MNRIEAGKMVAEALEQRRKFGKHFTVSDMPPEFLDALVIEFDGMGVDLARALDAAQKGDKARQEAGGMEMEIKELREQLTKANRQLGAAKSRETKLRNEVAELKLAVDLAGKKAE